MRAQPPALVQHEAQRKSSSTCLVPVSQLTDFPNPAMKSAGVNLAPLERRTGFSSYRMKPAPDTATMTRRLFNAIMLGNCYKNLIGVIPEQLAGTTVGPVVPKWMKGRVLPVALARLGLVKLRRCDAPGIPATLLARPAVLQAGHRNQLTRGVLS